MDQVLNLPLIEIIPNPRQPRKRFREDELSSLVESIKAEGVLQPILVRRRPGGYELIAGERRWQAALEAGMEEIPAVIREARDEDLMRLALIENVMRDDLDPMEIAQAYKALMDEEGFSQAEIAKAVGKTRSAIANTVRLIDLPPGIQSLLKDGKISEGHARALLSISKPSEAEAMAERVVKEDLSVRALERLLRREKGRPRTRRKRRSPLSVEASAMEERLMKELGTRVRLSMDTGGGGRLEVEFYSKEDLNRIYERIIRGA